MRTKNEPDFNLGPGTSKKIKQKDNGSCYFILLRFTCRGLFERHKLLFSFQMCSKILEAAGKLNMDEYNFFLRGGVVSAATYVDESQAY